MPRILGKQGHDAWPFCWGLWADSLISYGSHLEAPDLKQEERLQELESCSGVGSTSDDTEVREVSSRPSTPGLSVVSGELCHVLKGMLLRPLSANTTNCVSSQS